MDQPTDNLFDRADAALAEALRECAELHRNVASGWTICRSAQRAKIFQEGLPPPLAISLCVSERPAWSVSDPSAKGS